jgi:hypothetical protein
MFSRDSKHYRPTPRTTSEAFGPYHKYQSVKQARWDFIQVALGVIALGVVYGLLFGWRG